MSLAKHPRRLLVIITEAVLEKRLVADARRLGALGYTVWDVRGGGAQHEREGGWDADRSIEFKTVCTAEVADALAEHVMAQYAPHHSLVLYFADVQVVRPERYK